MTVKPNEEIARIMNETRIDNKKGIIYDVPYKHPRFLGLSDFRESDNFIGGINNVRNREVREDYLEKLEVCGERYNDSAKIEKLLKDELLEGIKGEMFKIVTIVGILLIYVPAAFILLFSFFVSKGFDITTVIGVALWLILGTSVLIYMRKKNKDNAKLNDDIISNVQRGMYKAYAFTVSDRKYYFYSGDSNHNSESYFYVFTSSGLNFNVDSNIKYAAADIGSKMIVLLCESSGKKKLYALIDN